MHKTRPQIRRAAALPIWRRGLTLAVLVLFAAQSWLLQTHIHLPGPPSHPGLHHLPAPGPAGDPATCPVCQDMAQAGAYLSPAAIILRAPSRLALIIYRAPAPPSPASPRSHFWHGRGPPQV